jgi:hypothetical protein
VDAGDISVTYEFKCSDAGSFITGPVIIADGGLTPH